MANKLMCICQYCGGIFWRYPSQLTTKTRFCSQKCLAEYRSNTNDQFWSRVDKSGGPNACWPWTGSLKNGYGRFYLKGHDNSTHRYAYELINGPIPKDLFACHHCDNRRCCNPTHVFIGTCKDNIQDAISKGIMPYGNKHWTRLHPELICGEHNPSAHLTAEQVQTIRLLYKQGHTNMADLGRQYKVTRKTIARLIQRKTWQLI